MISACSSLPRAPAKRRSRLTESTDAETGDATVIGWGMMQDGTFPNDLMQADLKLFPISACNAGIKEIYAKDLDIVLRSFAPRMRYSDAAVATATQAIVATMTDPLTGNMICAGEATGERDACNGDSGGPLFVKNGDDLTQVGVVSWGEGPMDQGAACGHANAYGVYTRLGNYKDWIASTIAAGGGPGEPGAAMPVTQAPAPAAMPAAPIRAAAPVSARRRSRRRAEPVGNRTNMAAGEIPPLSFAARSAAERYLSRLTDMQFRVAALNAARRANWLGIAVLVFEIAEIGRQGGAAGVEGDHADEGAGERAVLAAPAFVGDHAGVEHRADRQPAIAGAVEELQLRAVDLRGEPDRRIAGQRRSPRRAGTTACRPASRPDRT